MRESSFVLVVDVSIMIPAYRAEGFLRRAIESVLAQTFARWELIVVADDGVDYGAVLRSQGVDDARIRFDSTGLSTLTAGDPGSAHERWSTPS